MIKFSVVIPLYNKEKEIVGTIQSVLNQTYMADEIIVVDDGSTDDSVQRIHQNFKEKITIFSQVNLGVSSARNRGMIEAKNEYICFLDSDDVWEEEFLEEIDILIELFPKAIFYSTAHKYINENGKFLKGKVTLDTNYRGMIDDFAQTFQANYGLVNSSSVCVKLSSDILFPQNEKKGEDLCAWLALSLKGSLAFSAKPLSVYRLNTSNRSNTIHKEAIVPCPIKWFYQNKEQLKTHKYYKSIRKFIYSNIFITIYGGFGLSKDHTSIDAVISLMKQNNDNFHFLLYPAHWIPVWLLEKIQLLRRKFR